MRTLLVLALLISSCCAKPFCTADTCKTGCCDENDRCEAGDSATACGWGGRTCMNCAGSECGSVFGLHACATALCNPDNCAGCCTSAGSCEAGVTAAVCGANGNACTDCGAKSCSNGACN